MTPSRPRFGILLAPLHKPGINPTLALESDFELVQCLDRRGYGKAWLGERHSVGGKISAFPEIFIACRMAPGDIKRRIEEAAEAVWG